MNVIGFCGVEVTDLSTNKELSLSLSHGIPSTMSSNASYADLLPTVLSARAAVDNVPITGIRKEVVL